MITVLVVDDSVVDRHLAGACIREAGLQPIYASDGREAIGMIATMNPDIVLTDLQMPELDGLELVKRIRKEFPMLPTILMTAWGSEEIAATALREGAASYVPKKNLKQALIEALEIVVQSARSAQDRRRIVQMFSHSESHYELDYAPGNKFALVSHLQDQLVEVDFCDEVDVIRMGTALTEALDNALDHGNLELCSSLREQADAYRQTGRQRAQLAPYRDRRVSISVKLNRDRVTYVVRDEGPGFNTSELPNPTDSENLLKPNGRGVMLIRVFMDEVSYSREGNVLTMTKHRVVK